MLRGNRQRYGRIERAFHWLTAVLFLMLVALGAWMTELDYYDRWQPLAIRWHRSIGIVLLAVIATRLLWRFADLRPEPHPDLAPWERRTSETMHRFLLAALVVLPVSGYLFSTSKGNDIMVLWGVTIPAITSFSKTATDVIDRIHAVGAYVTLAAVTLHAAAAVRHHLHGKPEILRRML